MRAVFTIVFATGSLLVAHKVDVLVSVLSNARFLLVLIATIIVQEIQTCGAQYPLKAMVLHSLTIWLLVVHWQ